VPPRMCIPIGAVELRNAVSAKFGTELPATATFDHPTVAALATFVATRLAPPGQAAAVAPAAAPASVQQQAGVAGVQQKLQAAVDELLGFAVPPDQPLMEAGLDSIGGCIWDRHLIGALLVRNANWGKQGVCKCPVHAADFVCQVGVGQQFPHDMLFAPSDMPSL
jgi:Phosphopantetheine attachment site